MADEVNQDAEGGVGAVRLERANRTQIALVPLDLEATLPAGHAARLVWRFVEGLDLRAFHATIRAREGRAGRSAIDPQILIALWLYATIDGIGSAREVARLCTVHDAYRWLCGGVSVCGHTLSDFRVAHEAALDDLLTQSIAVLLRKGMVSLARVAQDGTRVRASAGVGSFRTGPRLTECLAQARRQVTRLARQRESGVSPSAAAVRGAAERLARVEEALAELPAVAAVKARRRDPRPAKASTTDPDARVMKLMDGGYRPAYNVQLASDMDSGAVLGVAVTNQSTDHGTLVPMLTQVTRRAQRRPGAVVADGGYRALDAIATVTAAGTLPYIPVKAVVGGRSPTTPCPGDPPAVAAWRARMATAAAQALYRQRGSVAERLNADLRTHRTFQQVGVRGLAKVHCWALWAALAINVMRAMTIVPHLMT